LGKRATNTRFFEKFKVVFGDYPTSVGAWWVGAQPINYMRQKYSITAVLHCADQFMTDAYSIWGTPWSIPYIPRKDNSAVPTNDKSTGVIVMQWAPRDLLLGYGRNSVASTYSAQDFHIKNYNASYLDHLSSSILSKNTGQFVVGLENGFPPDVFNSGGYKEVMQKVKQWQEQGTAQITTMKDTAQKLLSQDDDVLKPLIKSKGYENDDESYWYHSENFRINLTKTDQGITIRDIRDYHYTGQEEFYKIPNIHPYFKVDTHALIDSIRFPENEWKISNNTTPLTLEAKNNQLTITQNEKQLIKVSNKTIQIDSENEPPTKLKANLQQKNNQWYYQSPSTNQREWTSLKASLSVKNSHALQDLSNTQKQITNWATFRKRNWVITGIVILLSITILYYTTKATKAHPKTRIALILLLVTVISTSYIYKLTTQKGTAINDFEIEALYKNNLNSENAVIVLQEKELDYQSVVPYLYKDSSIPIITLTHDNKSEIKNIKDKKIIVPRYMFSDLFDPELRERNKIFDNSQIAIYE
jgi:hypothetical protein